MHVKSAIRAGYRPRVLTLIVLVVVAAPIVLANDLGGTDNECTVGGSDLAASSVLVFDAANPAATNVKW